MAASISYVDLGAVQRIESGSETAKTDYVDIGAVQRLEVAESTYKGSIRRIQDEFYARAVSEWTQNWAAQGSIKSAPASRITGNQPPRHSNEALYELVVPTWVQSWDAQGRIKKTPPTATVQPKANRYPQSILDSWNSDWSAQDRIKLVPIPVPVQQLKPLPYPDHVFSSWKEDWQAQQGNKSTPPSSTDQPRANRYPQAVLDAWTQDWNTPERLKVVALIPPIVGKAPYVSPVFAQIDAWWLETWLYPSSTPPNAGWNVRPPDQPIPRQLYGMQQILGEWQVPAWNAQRGPVISPLLTQPIITPPTGSEYTFITC
jgi:hypothetical protein